MNEANLEIATEELFRQQVAEWDLAARNYAGLRSVITRNLQFEGFRMRIQCNPERIVSSAAKVDSQSILARKCFLCPAQLPEQQRGLDYSTAKHRYKILVNPFPIFPKHLTMPDVQHTPQRIVGRVSDMLQLAKELEQYILFYNGPKCGASAPDHFHFQAGSKGMLPIENEWKIVKGLRFLRETDGCTIWTMENYLRKVIVMQGKEREPLARTVEQQINALALASPEQEPEPMLNLLASYENGVWTLFLFPRKQHRPTQFFETGERQIVFSPGSVDMGGLLIIPRKEDYEKLTNEIVSDMFKQVSGQ